VRRSESKLAMLCPAMKIKSPGSQTPGMLHSHPRRMAPAAAVLACVLAVALPGCGSSSSPGANANPATVVPSAAPLYVGAIVQPSGSLKSDTVADAQKLTGSSEPFNGLLKLLAPNGVNGSQLNYGRDVKPWLGEQAGAFVASIEPSSTTQALLGSLSEGISGGSVVGLGEGTLHALLGAKGTQGAVVLDTTDVGKARAFLEARAREAGAHTATYRDVSYQVSASGTAEGIVGSFAVIGTETALHEVIETERAGAASSIVHATGYAKLAAAAEPGALANFYLRTSGLPSFGGLLAGTEQAYLSLLPGTNSIALDIDTIPTAQPAQRTSASEQQAGAGLIPNASAAQAAGALPGGSWLAAGIGNVSATFGQKGTLSLLKSLGALAAKVKVGTYSLEGVFAPLSSRAVDLDRDLLSWMGSAGVFVSGNGLLNLQAGIVATSNDPARSREAVGTLARAYQQAGAEATPTTIPGAEVAETVKISGFPAVVAIGAGEGKFALGLGPASVQEALSPSTTLSGSASYQAAAATLGHGLQPSLLVEFPTLVTLIETLGLNQTAGISTAFPYLKSLTTLTAGGGEPLGGGVTRARVVLGLQ
jgi:Protein of unknown function (DUF3352)